jgi:hypothetical protein
VYNYYKSLPGYLSMAGNIGVIAGIILLFFNWRISTILFSMAVLLWLISLVLHDIAIGRKSPAWIMAQKYKNPEVIARMKATGTFDEVLQAMQKEAESMLRRRYRFWGAAQFFTLLLILTLSAASLFLTWWWLVPVLPVIGLNAVAYKNKMLMTGRDPATSDLDEVL